MLDALTQGRTRREALEMVKDWLETAVNRSDFHATVHEKGRVEFEVSGSDATSMIALYCAAAGQQAARRSGTWHRDSVRRREMLTRDMSGAKLHRLSKSLTHC
jgi:hypothetical protein